MDALLLRDPPGYEKKGDFFFQLDKQFARGSFEVGSSYLLDVFTLV